MADKDDERRSGRLRTALAALLVVALVAAGGLAWRTGWAGDAWDRLRGHGEPSADPAAIAPPPELDLPGVVRPRRLARAADGSGPLDRAALDRALAPLQDPDLGRHVIAAVGPLDGDGVAWRAAEGARVAVPASTTKIVTSAAALFLLGPDRRFETTTVLDTTGATPRLVLVGGGDPYLAREPDDRGRPSGPTFQPDRADVRTLARRTARALKAEGVRRVELAYDDTLFTGPQVHPTWEPDYIPDDVVSPISSLWVDQGREADSFDRVADPAATAAAEFGRALQRYGVEVAGEPVRGTAPPSAAPVGKVRGPDVAAIVQRVLEASDNEAAEVLLRHVGLADQGSGSFDAGQAAVERVLTANGIDVAGTVLYDGSGLSRASRIAPSVLLDVLRLAASEEHPDLRPVLTGLPVAAFTGSLSERMDRAPAAGRGRVRAKTGTLTGVTSLAGIAVDLDGNLMVFALLADRVRKPKEGLARIAMDNAAAGLGACRCGR
ncbi:D-alanyl-D-alanine carboxypeptidase/D-alanyl-D-alanine endopeptidase [Nocardioides sp. SYSU DS0651]|uniref:D-alanyl-D-alanine carboxypeptidase/D-alanyl-D-alanine endopeptidase n=1 Tax=Nocardioides sp. SYSU DS0651 TaxID=3415955 RepID=UPI003F4BD0E2